MKHRPTAYLSLATVALGGSGAGWTLLTEGITASNQLPLLILVLLLSTSVGDIPGVAEPDRAADNAPRPDL